MHYYYSNLVSDSEDDSKNDSSYTSLAVTGFFWDTDILCDETLYQQIVFSVSRKPSKLILHLQRIHFTYTKQLTEQLYAALVDLLWILDGKGTALSHRMVLATYSLLPEPQVTLLNDYLNKQSRTILIGNEYSVVATGLTGTCHLLSGEREELSAYDPLLIAQDYIEYSQLDAAIETLEQAVIDTPGRKVLQTELVNLYKVTRNVQGFLKMYSKLSENNGNISIEWEDLAAYFEGTVDEE